jgi:hypothetical protein
VNKLITTFNERQKDSSINGFELVDMWKDIIVTGGEFKNGAIVQTLNQSGEPYEQPSAAQHIY